MDIENIRKLTPYPDINGLLGDWVEGVKNILGGNVVGLYHSGFLSYGGFVLERSNIDLQAVVQHQLKEKELQSVEHLHKDLNQRHPARSADLITYLTLLYLPFLFAYQKR